jgi:hypothetical protein
VPDPRHSQRRHPAHRGDAREQIPFLHALADLDSVTVCVTLIGADHLALHRADGPLS